MEEPLATIMFATADVLHWFGKYREGNACTLLGRLLRLKNIYTVDDFEAYVLAQEAADDDAAEVEG